MLDGRPGPFRAPLGSMGADTELFAWLLARGRAVVWSERAIVFEAQEPERSRWRWHLARGFARGRSWTSQLRQQRGALGIVLALASIVTGATKLLGRSLAQLGNPRAALL